MHASGGVDVTSGAEGEDVPLTWPMRVSHFLAIDGFMNRNMAQSEPKSCNKDFVRILGRGTLTFLLDWNGVGGDAENHFATSEGSPQLQNFMGLTAVSTET